MMEPIRCAHCGAENPPDSKFCNRCGQAIRSHARQVCPSCTTPNSRNLLYCDNCGTRLLGDKLPKEEPEEDDSQQSRTQPFSLPARPPGQTAELDYETGLPDWLKTGDDAGHGRAAEESKREMAAEEGSAQEPDRDDSLEAEAGASAEPLPQEPPDDVSDEEIIAGSLPDWLLDDEMTESFTQSEQGADEEDSLNADEEEFDEPLPDWLQALSEGEAESTDTGTSPATSAAADAEQEPVSGDDLDDWEVMFGGTEETAGTLDWLEEMSAEEIGGASEEEAEIPHWLAEPADASEDEAEAEKLVGAETPDWPSANASHTSALEPGVEKSPTESEPHEPGEAEVERAEAEQPALADEAPASEGRDDEEAFAAWLAEATSQTAAEGGAAGAEAEAELPLWMLEDEMPPGFGEIEEDQIPDWLREMSEPTEATTAESTAEELAAEAADVPDSPTEIEGVEEPPAAEQDEVSQGEVSQGEVPEWLASAEEEAEAEAVADEDELPDWLTEVELEEEADRETEGLPEAQALPEAPEEEEPPDWLGELDENLAETAPGEAEPLATAELPDWLMEMAPPEMEADLLAPATPEDLPVGGEDSEAEMEAFFADMDGVDELPDWLDEVEAAAPPAQNEEPPAEEAGEAPEWLELDEALPDDLTLLESERARENGPEVVPHEELPAWLDDVMFELEETDEFLESEAEEVTTAEEAPAAPETSEEGRSMRIEGVPEELAGAELPVWLEESAPIETTPDEAQRAPLEEVPEWLRPPAEAEAAAEVEEAVEFEHSGEWSADFDELPPEAEAEIAAAELQEAEIPDWLRALKPRALLEEEEADVVPEETSGPLAGLRDVIGIAPVVAERRRSEMLTPTSTSETQQQQVTLLRQLVRSDATDVVVATGHPGAADRSVAGSPLLRVLLAVLLLAALLTGLFLPDLLSTAPPPAPATGEVPAAVAAAAGESVLVAFDYTPAMAGALEAPAREILEALEAGESEVLFVSQSPAGLPLATAAVAEFEALDALSLGYLPGEAVGLRRLASCLAPDAACASLTGAPLSPAAQERLAEVNLVVVVTGEREDLVNWIEQVDTFTTKPLVAAVTPAVAPVALPYYTSGQLEAFTAAPDRTTATETTLDALALGHWTVIGLLGLGNLYYLLLSLRPRRTTSAGRVRKVRGEG
ncbi:MAG: zinc ribbon domain-containing protein [Candidatus Promineifilaceae bacterium]|nr:zinc ribbon domain-containing protein [Candidatus Promineifilaceae bacterium]